MEGGDPTGVVYMALWKNGAYTSSQQMLNMMASVISNNNPQSYIQVPFKEQSGPAIMTRANGQLILVPAIL